MPVEHNHSRIPNFQNRTRRHTKARRSGDLSAQHVPASIRPCESRWRAAGRFLAGYESTRVAAALLHLVPEVPWLCAGPAPTDSTHLLRTRRRLRGDVHTKIRPKIIESNGKVNESKRRIKQISRCNRSCGAMKSRSALRLRSL